MRALVMTTMLLCSSIASADVLNVEFKFTPYTGDLKEDHVTTVPGKARVYLNNVLAAEQDIAKQSVPVIFDEREIAPSVWVPVASMGPAVRKGKNSIRIEFVPADANVPYHGQLSWATVTDQTSQGVSASGAATSTNQSGEGKEDKPAKGKLVLGHEFTADFAKDLPWHHYPAVTALSDGDRQQIGALVNERGQGFKPDFAGVYTVLSRQEGVQVAAIRKSRCLDAAYAAGVRIQAAKLEELDFLVSGNPEVVVERKSGQLYGAGNDAAFGKIKGDEAQMCAGMVLAIAFPPHLAFVRSPAGKWEVAY